MCVVMLLALRLPFIEKMTKGLDKSYHLHKWFGISAVIVAISHWVCAVGAKYAVGWGLLEKPERTPKSIDPDSLVAVLRPFRHSAEMLGELFFYLMVVLAVISLLHHIGYKVFKLSHKLMAVCFIVTGYHSAMLISPAYWNSPITYVTLTVIIIGIGAALWSLAGKIGKKQTYDSVVSSFTHDRCNQVTDLRLSAEGWPGHKNGQFVYLNFGGDNIHPFTIAGLCNKTTQLRFLIKELGDFTSVLKSSLTVGQPVSIEGPYGKFDFDDTNDQLWIAGGIGIAAFKAELQARQHLTVEKSVTLYYCTLRPSETLISELKKEASLANIVLKVIDGRSDPLLTVAILQSTYEDLTARSIWFCGPTNFSNQLKKDLTGIGYNLNLFHQEYFSMR